MKNFWILIISALLLSSCGSRSSEKKFIADFENAMEKDDTELASSLEELNSRYPENLAVIINLGAVYLASGETEKAGKLLESGIGLAEKSRDKVEKYSFYSNIAECRLRERNYSESEYFSGKALENSEDDTIGVKLTLAKALTMQGKYSEAYPLFNEKWETDQDSFSDEDLFSYITVISYFPLDEEALLLAVRLFDELWIKNPSIEGTWLKQAQILETAGASRSALVSIFSEMETGKYEGSIDENGINETLNELASGLEYAKIKGNISDNYRLIDGYRNFSAGRWEKAEEAFYGVEIEVPVTFYSYLKLSSRIGSGAAGSKEMKEYALLERVYKNLQGYYLHYLSALEKGIVKYSDEEKIRLLKGAILASPFNRYAEESKVKLGRLHGIADGKKILLDEEVRFYCDAVRNGASTGLLGPVALLLEMEDNVFVSDALAVLEDAFADKTISEWFVKKAEESGNALFKSRIASLGADSRQS